MLSWCNNPNLFYVSVFYDYFKFEHYFVVLVILKPNTSVIAEPNIFKIRKDSEASRSLIVPDFTIRLAEFVLSHSLTFFEDSFIARNWSYRTIHTGTGT